MADEEDVSVKIWQRCVIEFCVKLGKSGNETLEMLRQAYGGETLSCAAVFQCWRHFKDGNTRVIDKARSGFCCSLMRTGWSYSNGFPMGRQWTGTIMQTSWKPLLREAMRKKGPDLLKKQWFLLQDNARPHIAAVELAALIEIGGTALKYSPYSPDVAPCDFWAFPTLKRQLRGKRFSSDDEMRNATAAVLKGCRKTIYFMCSNRL